MRQVLYFYNINFVLATGEGSPAKRRPVGDSSIVYYEQVPKHTIESYQVYTKPTRTITQVTEERRVYQLPTEQKHSEMTYSIHGTQPKFQPVSFLVSASQDNQQQQRSSGLVATLAKQAGPTLSHYEQYMSHQPEPMQTETTRSTIRYAYSHEQPTTTSYTTSQPNFTKVCQAFFLDIILLRKILILSFSHWNLSMHMKVELYK